MPVKTICLSGADLNADMMQIYDKDAYKSYLNFMFRYHNREIVELDYQPKYPSTILNLKFAYYMSFSTYNSNVKELLKKCKKDHLVTKTKYESNEVIDYVSTMKLSIPKLTDSPFVNIFHIINNVHIVHSEV
jgi:hypothetical protein